MCVCVCLYNFEGKKVNLIQGCNIPTCRYTVSGRFGRQVILFIFLSHCEMLIFQPCRHVCVGELAHFHSGSISAQIIQNKVPAAATIKVRSRVNICWRHRTVWAVCGEQTVTWGASAKADVCPEPAGKNARNRGVQGSGGPEREHCCNREGKYVSLRLHKTQFYCICSDISYCM